MIVDELGWSRIDIRNRLVIWSDEIFPLNLACGDECLDINDIERTPLIKTPHFHRNLIISLQIVNLATSRV